VPVSHIWFFKCTPSRIGLVLDISGRDLERVLYYEDYIVVEAGDTPLKEKQLLNEMEFREAQEKYGENFMAKMGAEGIRDLMKKIDIEKRWPARARDGGHPQQTDAKETDQADEGPRRISFERFETGMDGLGSSASYSPGFEALVPLEGGRFATSDSMICIAGH